MMVSINYSTESIGKLEYIFWAAHTQWQREMMLTTGLAAASAKCWSIAISNDARAH